ncbi:hypothetical protein CYMTET_7104, partial [Cymbomonas tetramitiformis]
HMTGRQVTTRLHTAAAIGALAWHGSVPNPEQQVVAAGSVPLQGLHRKALVDAGNIRGLLDSMTNEIEIEELMFRGRMLKGKNVIEREVKSEYTNNQIEVRETAAAALMLLVSADAVIVTEDVKKYLNCLEDVADGGTVRTQLFLSAGLWCLGRRPTTKDVVLEERRDMLIEFQRLEEAIVEDMPRDLEGPTDDLVERSEWLQHVRHPSWRG